MNMEAERLILSRGLPKTGQSVVYQAGDDGDYQAGWWQGRTLANNKTRYVTKTIAGDDVVIDLATGLMWARDGNEAGCNNGAVINFANGILYAEALTFAGFSDWRLPNILEIVSICDYSQVNPCIDTSIFPNTKTGYYRSSSTPPDITTLGFILAMQFGAIGRISKNNTYYIRCVRGGL